MKDIVDRFLKWKADHDEDYVYDEIHDFFADLSRGEMLDVMEYVVERWEESSKKK